MEEYPPDALVPNPARRRLDRMLKLSHTAEGEAWRNFVRADPDDPARAQYERDARAAMERQRELMALRATVPAIAPVSATPLAGKLRRHELGYKNVLDTLRTALANLESDFAVLLAKRGEEAARHLVRGTRHRPRRSTRGDDPAHARRERRRARRAPRLPCRPRAPSLVATR